MSMNKRKVGGEYEKLAASYLVKHGLSIIEMNFRVKAGEIDIIAKDGEYLVFAEVKYRSGMNQGGAAYAISASKKRKIYRIAQWYMSMHHIPQDTYCRFDAVLIDREDITYIKNAWQA